MDELQSQLESLDAVAAAQRLLGSTMLRDIGGNIIKVRIVETEAYHQADAASHSYRGRTPRTDVMFGPAGRLYVYFTYGMHYCCNVVVGEENYGAAVLIRAVEPVSGEATMRTLRDKQGVELTNGPAKLCRALDVDLRLNGHNLSMPPFQLMLKPPLPPRDIVQTPRIGISHAIEEPWRFYVKHNVYASRR